jgi:hypothetical protein
VATSDTLQNGTPAGSAHSLHRLPLKIWYMGGGAATAYITLLPFSDIGTSEGERIYNPDPPPLFDQQTFLGIRGTTWLPILYVVTVLVLVLVLCWLIEAA